MTENELKLMDLATQCGVLVARDEVAQVYGAKKADEIMLKVRVKAAKLARELFPPMANPT